MNTISNNCGRLFAIILIYLMSALTAKGQIPGHAGLPRYVGIDGPTQVCPGKTFEYTVVMFGGIVRKPKWIIEYNGSIIQVNAMDFSASVIWNAPGIGRITCILGSDTGHLDVLVKPLPSPKITPVHRVGCYFLDINGRLLEDSLMNPDGACVLSCENNYATYKAHGDSGSVFNWSVVGGTIISQNGTNCTVLWDNKPGTIIKVAETSLAGCTGTDSLCIELIKKPTALFEAIGFAKDDPIELCLNSNIVFNDLSTGAPSPIINWHWDFGDGHSYSSGTKINPEHAYTQPGDFRVILTVTNGCGCSSQFARDIKVIDVQIVNIECPAVVCESQTVKYTLNDPSVRCELIRWHPIGGSIANEIENDVYIRWDEVDENGYGYLTAQALGCEGYCSGITTVKVPVITSTGKIQGSTILCEGQQFIYRLPAWPGTFYNWNLSDTVNAKISHTDQPNEIVVTALNPTNLKLQCNYTNELIECGGQAQMEIEVHAIPTITGNRLACIGTNQEFVLNGAVGNWAWKLTKPDGAVTVGANNSNTFYTGVLFAKGIYSLEIITNGCAAPRFLFEIVDKPTPPGNILGDSMVCLNSPYNYTVQHAPNASLLRWQVYSNANATINPSGSPATAKFFADDQYVIQAWNTYITDKGFCNSDTASYSVTTGFPKPKIVGNALSCTNSYEKYYVNKPDGETYEWKIFSDVLGSVSEGNNSDSIKVLWNNIRSNALLTVKVGKCGLTRADSLVVTLNNFPTAVLISADTICSGAPLSIVNTVPTGITATWNFGDGVVQNYTNTSTVDHTYKTNIDSSIKYQIKVTYKDQCNEDVMLTHTVVVKPSPKVSISPAADVISCNAGFNHLLTAILQHGMEPTVQLIWTTPSGPSSCTGLPPACSTYSATAFGTYSVTAVGQNGCTSVSNIVAIIKECGDTTSGQPDSCVVSPMPVVSVLPQNSSCGSIRLSGTYTTGGFSPTWSSTPVIVNLSSTPGQEFLGKVSEARAYNFKYSVSFSGTGAVSGAPCVKSLSDFASIVVPVVPDLLYAVGCGSGNYSVDLMDHSTSYGAALISGYSFYVNGSLHQQLVYPNYTLNLPLSPGAHSVKLVVHYTVNGVSDSCEVEKTIYLPALPTVGFYMDRQGMCQNQPVKFHNTSAGYGSVLWSFGDNSGNTQPHPIRTYSKDGTYDVVLTIQDSFHCAYSTSQTISINKNNLGGQIDPTGHFSLCPGDSLTITYLPNWGSTAPSEYHWKSNHSNVAQTNVNHFTIYATGNHWVSVKDTNNCEQSINLNKAHVELKALPFPYIKGKSRYCEGDTIVLSGNDDLGITFQWILDGNWLSENERRLVLEDLVAGEYSVQLFISDSSGLCSAMSDTFVLTILAKPAPPIITPVIVDCSNYQVQLQASVAGVSGNYAWSNGEAGSSIIIRDGGPFKVWFTSDEGCQSSEEINILPKNPQSYLWIFPTGCIDHCPQNLEAIIHLPGPIIPFDYWDWQRNGSILNSGTNTVVEPLEIVGVQYGTYNLALGNGCAVKSGNLYYSPSCYRTECDFRVDMKFIDCGEDNRTPLYEFYIDNNSVGSAIYQIVPLVPGGSATTFGGTVGNGSHTIPVIWQPTQHPQNPVKFVVYFWLTDNEKPCYFILESDFPCEGEWRKSYTNAPLLLKEAFPETGRLKMFPNPASGIVQLQYVLEALPINNVVIDIFDLMGRRMKRITTKETRGVLSIPVSDLATGSYFIHLTQNGKTVAKEKLVVNVGGK